jgi:ribonuclease G
MAVVTNEKCPTCLGSGEIQSSVSIVDDIDSHIKYLIENLHLKGFTIEVHPFLAAYLKNGWLNSCRFNWFWKYKQWIKVIPNSRLHLVDYKFMDAKGEEVIL